jgi:hypothetical protein
MPCIVQPLLPHWVSLGQGYSTFLPYRFRSASLSTVQDRGDYIQAGGQSASRPGFGAVSALFGALAAVRIVSRWPPGCIHPLPRIPTIDPST